MLIAIVMWLSSNLVPFGGKPFDQFRLSQTRPLVRTKRMHRAMALAAPRETATRIADWSSGTRNTSGGVKMTTKSIVRFFSFVLVLFGLAACGGGGGGGGPPASPIADVSGTWSINEQGVSNCAGQETFKRGPYPATVTQTGNNLTVVTSAGTFSGTINGDKISWGGSYPEQGGTTTINSMTLTVAADGNSFSGSATWSWSDGTEKCSGTTQAINGTRVPGTGPKPPAPTGLTATPQSSSVINLSWSPGAVSTTAKALQELRGSGYQIERRSPDSEFQQIQWVTLGTTTYPDSKLSSNTLYYYRVRAYNANGESDYSNIASAMTGSPEIDVPTPPSGLQANALSSTSIALSWTDTIGDQTGFKIERSTNATSGFAQIDNGNLGPNDFSYTDTGLTGDTTYYYRVFATNSAGDSSPSNVVSASTQPPPVPSLSGPTTSTGSFTVTWTYAWSGGLASTGDGYELQESTTGSTSGFTSIYSTVNQGDHRLTESYSLTRTTGTYYYQVRALQNGTYSPWSNVLTVTVTNTPSKLLKITNNLSGSGLNTVVRLRIGGTVNEIKNTPSTERLEPDDYCELVQGRDIEPGEIGTFDVSSLGSSYVVFIGLGFWDPAGSCNGFEKRNFVITATDDLRYMYQFIQVSNHTSGTVAWTLRYDANGNLVIDTGTSLIPFVYALNYDPIVR